jgi:large subunit ribosomal protein L29
METDKIRNLTSDELVQQEKDSMDQLFRLKFQMKMGQTESLNKIRGLRKDIARMKTVARQRELEAAQKQEKK